MTNKIILYVLISLTLLSCGSPTKIKVTVDDNSLTTHDTLITCEHHYDVERKFTYYKKNAEKRIIHDRLTIYKFEDIQNKVWFINNFEIENYLCEFEEQQ